MIGDVLQLYKYIKEEVEDANILTALFSHTGKRKHGDPIINVKKRAVSNKTNQWFYEIEDYGNYFFIPFPINPAVYTDYGIETGHENPSTKIFRYVSSPMAKYSSGGEENVEVDFFVFGYQPSDLINRKKKTI